ncbi:MAG: orotidine-5'-phosphate decarboxylase, partial [Sphingobacteriia bacterium]
MHPDTLKSLAHTRRSCLCVGLDTDPELLPPAVHGDVLAFNKAIIEATLPYALAYKFNLAFYEAQGLAGWRALEESLALIPEGYLTIADAKRGDIGNTARRYAQAFFEQLNFDAITVAPYMGHDSILPFLDYPGKWVFLLG